MNESNAKTDPQSANSGAQILINTASEVFSRHAENAGAPAGAIPPNGAQAPMGAPAGADPLVVARAFSLAIRAIDAGLVRRIGATAMRLTNDREFADQIVADTRLSREEIDLIGTLTADVARKYSFAMEYAPEIALGVVITGYGARLSMTVNRLAEIARTVNQAPKVSAQPAEQGRAS